MWGCDVRSVIRFQNHRRCYSKTHCYTSEVQSFVNKINNWLACKCYIATMLFDSCRAHTFKSSHMRLFVLLFWNGHGCNIIYCFFSQILSLTLQIRRFILLLFTFNHCFRISYCGKREAEYSGEQNQISEGDFYQRCPDQQYCMSQHSSSTANSNKYTFLYRPFLSARYLSGLSFSGEHER